MSSPQIWINGALTPVAEARIDPFDHGFLTGDGVFETMIVYRGKAFAVERHWKRLQRSAAVLALDLPSREELENAITSVIKANQRESGRIRVTLTGGPAPLGSEKGDAASTFVVAVADLPKHGTEGDLITVPFRRNEHGALSNHKTISYGENVVALAYAKKQGGSEAIFANTAGSLCEGTGSNIFIVYEGDLVTPPVSAGCLPGITRALVLELCEKLDVPVQQRNVPLRALAEASEAFLTSSLREVQPVRTVDGNPLANCPGEFSLRLRDAYRELTASTAAP